MGHNEHIRRQRLEALIRRLPKTYWGSRFANLQEAKKLGISVVGKEDDKR